MKNLDEYHVALRQCWRLKRRQNISHDPDDMWHMDGDDKLKLCGFAIHGTIDGLGRKIISLHVSSSNNNPAYIAYYFIQTVTNWGEFSKLFVETEVQKIWQFVVYNGF